MDQEPPSPRSCLRERLGPPPGWETSDKVAARFDAAVRAALTLAGGQPAVLVTHGQAMTCWLAATGRRLDPGAFWESLTYPDAWSVGEEELTRLTRPRH